MPGGAFYLGDGLTVDPVTRTVSGGGGGGASVDSTLTQSGQAADAAEVGNRLSALSEEIADLKGNIPSGGGSGLTDDEKTLMLSLFENAVFNDIDMSATLNQLKNLFNGGEPNTFSVTYNLTDITSDNTGDVVKEGFPFTATLTAAEGFLIREDNLSVTMGGVDITNSVYVDGVISIPVVTGEIIITAQGRDGTVLYILPNETVFNGATLIDTGVNLFDKEKSFTIMLDFSTTTKGDDGKVFSEIITGTTAAIKNGYSLSLFSSYYWRVYSLNQFVNTYTQYVTHGKIVITYNVDTQTETIYTIEGGAIRTNTRTLTFASMIGVTDTMKLGAGYIGTEAAFNGTIHRFEAYSKVVDEATINEFMGVA